MPTISEFFGILIRMYWDEHPPPHFHAFYAEHEAQYNIATLDVIHGALPRRAHALVVEWASLHKEELGSMSSTSAHNSHRTPGVVIMAVWSIVGFKILPNYKIDVTFADGTKGVADLAPRLSQGRLGDGFDALCDAAALAKAYLEHGALTWPGGIDLAPDAMYQRIRDSGTSTLAAKIRKVA